MCPPVNTNLVDDYPNYYDPLYFPHLHLSVFENSLNFCNWLASALNSHKLMCHHCPIFEDVCIFYNGMIVSIACNARPDGPLLPRNQANGLHAYQLEIKKMKIMPYSDYVRSSFISKGKRKASGDFGSPSKKTATATTPGSPEWSDLTNSDHAMDV